MIPPVVSGYPVLSPVMMVGQAPGDKEGPAGKPFAWTAGKTLFKWFASIGVDEQAFRSRVYMAAVCRCFPGKNPKGGDRVPDENEIEHCGAHMKRELEILRPRLVIPVGKLAIAQFLPDAKQLIDIVGKRHAITHMGVEADVIPLPHPTGASTRHRMEPGKTLLDHALALVKAHPAWREIRDEKIAIPAKLPTRQQP